MNGTIGRSGTCSRPLVLLNGLAAGDAGHESGSEIDECRFCEEIPRICRAADCRRSANWGQCPAGDLASLALSRETGYDSLAPGCPRLAACRDNARLAPADYLNWLSTVSILWRRFRSMTGSLDRRSFLKSAAATGAAIGLAHRAAAPLLLAAEEGKQPLFKISLAEWSFHRMLFDRQDGQPRFPARRQARLRHRLRRVRQSVLHGQGEGHRVPDGAEEAVRRQRRQERADHVRQRGRSRRPGRREADRRPSRTITNGSRPRSSSAATRSASTPARAGSVRRAAEAVPPTACAGSASSAAKHGINVIVENHGGLSSNGKWLVGGDQEGRPAELRHAARLRQLPDQPRRVVRPLQGRPRDDALSPRASAPRATTSTPPGTRPRSTTSR